MADELLAEDTQCSGTATQYYDSASTCPSQVDHASRRDRHELQKLLPQGLVLDQQRSVPNCPYQVFDCLDNRLGIGAPIRRTISIIELTDLGQGADEWLKNLGRVTEQHLKCSTQPQAAARLDERSAYFILPWFPAVLADQIPATGVANRSLAWALLAQLIEGLAELHHHGFTHGDLRTATISLDTATLTQQSRVWLGSPGLHYVRRATDSNRLTSPSRETSWSEQGDVSTALRRDDISALGLVAVELFAGASARRKLESTSEEGSSIATSALRNQMWWWRRRFLIDPLLTNDRNQLRDAHAVLSRWQFILQAERLIKQGAVVFVAVALLVPVIAFASRPHPEENPKPQVTSADPMRLNELENALNASRSQLAETTTELEALRRRNPAKAASPSLDAEARQLWQQKFAGQPSKEYHRITGSLQPKPVAGVQDKLVEWKSLTRAVETDLQATLVIDPQGKTRVAASPKAYIEFQQAPWEERLLSRLAEVVWRAALADGPTSDAKIDSAVLVLSKLSSDNDLKNQLHAFAHELLQRRAKWARWESQPAKLIEPWNRLIETPWDNAAQVAERERFLALEAAEKSWREVAARGDLSWNEFKSQLKDAVGDNPRAAEVASVWIDQFNQLNAGSKAMVILIGGHSPPGFGVYRTIDVHVGGSYLALDDEVSGDNWDSETDYLYPTARTISFPWQPGQSIQVYIYGPRTAYRVGSRSALIQRKYSGPIGLWLMSQDQQITGGSGENPHRLQFRVENCPGPPPLPAELEKLQNVIAH
jgi:hypothetical protein